MKPLKINSFWAINDELTIEEACKQLDEFKTAGLTGVIFHPRFFPNQPDYLSNEYFTLLNQIILYAKEQQLEFWLYDENGWPSGTAGGKVMEAMPQLKQLHLELKDEHNKQDDAKILFEFTYKHEHQTVLLIEEIQPSPLDKKAVEKFVELTYQGYQAGLVSEAFEYVTGFFSDEVAMPSDKRHHHLTTAIPWSETLGDTYFKNCGRDLLQDLPGVFCDYFTAEENAEIRMNYWESAAQELAENFYDVVNSWCQKHDKRFIAHLKAEENIPFAIPFNGSAYEILKHIDLPGIDALERYPSNNYYPVLASSVAHQFGDGESFCEAQGGAGWGLQPKDMFNYFSWLLNSGISQFCLHLSQYRLNAKAMRDWPPSTPLHLTWSNYFHQIINEINQIPRKDLSKPEVLVISPVRGIMGQYQPWELAATNIHNGTNQPNTLATKWSQEFLMSIQKLADQGVTFHLTDEKTFEALAQFHSNSVSLGKMNYAKVIADPHCYFSDAKINSQISKFDFVEAKTPATMIDGKTAYYPSQSEWEAKPDQFNLYPFTETFIADGKQSTTIDFSEPMEIILLSSDKLKQININNKKIPTKTHFEKERYHYVIDKEYVIAGANKFTLTGESEEQPFCWLQGQFLVEANGTPEQHADYLRVNVQKLVPWEKQQLNPKALASSGLFFRFSPLKLSKKISIEKPIKINEVAFQTFYGDLAEIKIDGYSLLYWQQKNGNGRSFELGAGEYQIDLILYPSTFNANGPHHYLYGDRKIISPVQFEGVKNFADPADSSETTYASGLNYKEFGVGEIGFTSF